MVSVSLTPPPSRDGGSSGGVLRLAFLAVLVGAALGAGFWLGRATAPASISAAAPTPQAAASAASSPAAIPGTLAAPPGQAVAPPAAAPAQPAPLAAAPAQPASAAAAPPAAAPTSGRLVATIQGPLEEAVARAIPPADRDLAEQLTQVVNRLLVWDLRVSREAVRGDRLEVLYRRAGTVVADGAARPEPVVLAARYASQKLGRTLEAWRFQAPGEAWPRYYRTDGHELEERLVDAPLDDYDQVTSLLRDGRRHEGVDFRTPVGTPVKAPFDGVLERKNWNWRANGNCLELRDVATGRVAKFLHLDELPKDLKPGARFAKGAPIARSGNSGHSFAPHLHYQLEDASGRVLDPFEIHRTTRRALPDAARPAFDAERARLAAALGDDALAAAATR
ncbi:MAG: M23 family metallopeptidase [Anaeromyxobacteraceae bacterium]